jgi:subtilisin-like proprotein convertase family protein
MKRTFGSFVAANRRTLLFFAVLASLTVFGMVSVQIDAQKRQEKVPTNDPPAPSAPDPVVLGDPSIEAPAAVFVANAGSLGAIPDSPAGGTLCGDYTSAPLDVTFTVPAGAVTGPLTDVRVDFTANPAHTFVGDLRVTLISPGGVATHTVFSQTSSTTATGCGDPSDVAGPYNFFDTAPATPTWWEAAATASNTAGVALPAGDYRTSTPGGAAGGGANAVMTATFAGLSTAQIAGTWTLRFHDGGQGDTGAISAANLTLAGTAAPAQIIISEFRVRGPNGANDEFIEIMNRSTTDHTVAATGTGTGYGIAASNGVVRCTIPNGTVIPANGHFLCVNSVGYSLASYPAGNGTTATGDATYTTDIPDNAGIAIFSTNVPGEFDLATRLDAVGSTSEANTLYKEGTGYPALTPFSIDYSFYRIATGMASAGITEPTFPTIGVPWDRDNNALDLVFVDTNGTSAGAGQRLGAPGPENLSSPTWRLDGFVRGPLDSCVGTTAPPNFVRDFTSDPANNSTFGTIDLRRTFTNTTGGNITRLRFRIQKITTFPAPSGFSDLRPRTSSAVVVTVDRPPCGSGTSNITVQGTTLEQPPSQPNGGGFNSTMSAGVVTLATPLAPGASIDLRFLFGIQQTGTVRGSIAIDALPRGGAIWNFEGSTEPANGGVADVSGPTAAAASITGRVLTADGRGIRGALVTVTGLDGVTHTAVANGFGYYQFFDLTVGGTYVIGVRAKAHRFTPRAIFLADNLADIDFISDP